MTACPMKATHDATRSWLASVVVAAILCGVSTMAQDNLLQDGSFAQYRKSSPAPWEFRYGHKGGDFPTIRPYWTLVPKQDPDSERHPHYVSVEKERTGAGMILIGQRLVLPERLPPLDLAVEYQAFCDNDNRSGTVTLGVYSPAAWDALSADPAQTENAADTPDIFAHTVHNQGDDVTRWRLGRVPTASLHAALAPYAGKEVVVAVSFLTWHSGSEEWARLDNLWLGPPLPHIQPVAWPNYVFRGEPVTLLAEASSRDPGARVILNFRQQGETNWQSVTMTEAAPATYEGTMPATATDQPLEVKATVESELDEGLETEIFTMKLTERPEHPNLFFSKTELRRMREKVEEFDWARTIFERLKKDADMWLTKAFEPQVVSGYWWHHYNCAECGGRLDWEEDKPYAHQCTKCGNVWNTEVLHGVWWSGMHGMYVRAAQDLALTYQMTGNEAYARRAIEFLTWYANNYAQFPGGDKGGKIVSQTLDECVWLLKAMDAADLAYPVMTEEEARTIEQKLIRAGAMYTRKYRGGIHNIRCWHNACWASAGYFLGDPELVDLANNARYGFKDQMEQGVLEDGMWYERSLGYHNYTVSAISYHLKASMHAGDDLYLMEPVQKLLLFPLRITFPNMVTPSLNDGGFSRSPISPYPLERAVAWYDSQIALSAIAKRYSEGVSRAHMIPWQFGEELPEAAAYTPPPSMDLKGAGLAVLRQGSGDRASCVMVEYGEHGGGHGHPDKLQLILFGLGKQLCPDLGTVGYANPMHSGYYKTTPAHNTVTIGGRNMAGRRGQLLDFQAADGYAATCVTTGEVYENTILTRRVLLTDGIVVDEFIVEAEGDAPKDWFLRSDGQLAMSVETKPAQEEPMSTPYKYISDLQVLETGSQWSATWSYDRDQEGINSPRLVLTMQGEPGTQVGQCQAPGAAGTGALWPTLRIRRHAPRTRFLAVYQMLPPGKQAETVSFGEREIRVGNTTVLLGTDDTLAPTLQ